MHTKVKQQLENDLRFLSQELDNEKYKQVISSLMKLKHASEGSDKMISWSVIYYEIAAQVNLKSDENVSSKISDIALLLQGNHSIYKDPRIISEFDSQQEDVYQHLVSVIGE